MLPTAKNITEHQPIEQATLPTAYYIAGNNLIPSLYILGACPKVSKDTELSPYETARLQILAEYAIGHIDPTLVVHEGYPLSSTRGYFFDTLRAYPPFSTDKNAIVCLESELYHKFLPWQSYMPILKAGSRELYYPGYQKLMMDYPHTAMGLAFALQIACAGFINMCIAYMLSYAMNAKDTPPSWGEAIAWYCIASIGQFLGQYAMNFWAQSSLATLKEQIAAYDFEALTSYFTQQRIPECPAIIEQVEEKENAITARNQRWAEKLVQIRMPNSNDRVQHSSARHFFSHILSRTERFLQDLGLDSLLSGNVFHYSRSSEEHTRIMQHLKTTCHSLLTPPLQAQMPDRPKNILVFVGAHHLSGLKKEVAKYGLTMEPIELIPTSLLNSLTQKAREHKHNRAIKA